MEKNIMVQGLSLSELQGEELLTQATEYIRSSEQTIATNIFRIGEVLDHVAIKLHGRYTEWVRDTLPFSQTTARNYRNTFIRYRHLSLEAFNDIVNAVSIAEIYSISNEEVIRELSSQAVDGILTENSASNIINNGTYINNNNTRARETLDWPDVSEDKSPSPIFEPPPVLEGEYREIEPHPGWEPWVVSYLWPLKVNFRQNKMDGTKPYRQEQQRILAYIEQRSKALKHEMPPMEFVDMVMKEFSENTWPTYHRKYKWENPMIVLGKKYGKEVSVPLRILVDGVVKRVGAQDVCPYCNGKGFMAAGDSFYKQLSQGNNQPQEDDELEENIF